MEHRPLACSSRRLAANLIVDLYFARVKAAFGQRPNATGWQPVLPRQKFSRAVATDGLVGALEIGGRSFAAQIAVDAMPRFL